MKRLASIGYIAVYALVALAILWIFVLDPGLNGFFCSKLGEMVYGTAFKPYVYRTLLPSTTRLILWLLPATTKATVKAWVLHSPQVAAAFGMVHWETDLAAEGIISAILMYLSFFGFALSIRWLFTALYQTSSRMKDLLPIAALLGLPMFFIYSNYVYDPATVLLFTLCLALMARRKWALFLPLYAIASINKETTNLLTIIFVIHYFPRSGRMDWRSYINLFVPQLVIYATSRIALNKAFGGNPGDYFLFHLKDHQFGLLHAFPPTSYLAALAVFCLVFGHFGEKPAFLKNGLWIFGPLLGIATIYGFLDEYRAFYEAYPIVFLLGAQTIARLMGIPLEQTVAGAASAPAKA